MSVDIFKGFPDEESIVNYTLNQAYQDNVTVFASESFLWDQVPLPSSCNISAPQLPLASPLQPCPELPISTPS